MAGVQQATIRLLLAPPPASPAATARYATASQLRRASLRLLEIRHVLCQLLELHLAHLHQVLAPLAPHRRRIACRIDCPAALAADSTCFLSIQAQHGSDALEANDLVGIPDLVDQLFAASCYDLIDQRLELGIPGACPQLAEELSKLPSPTCCQGAMGSNNLRVLLHDRRCPLPEKARRIEAAFQQVCEQVHGIEATNVVHLLRAERVGEFLLDGQLEFLT
mmetsp:Transcript_2861/g.6551  ORF Transcript_2861/g.6551 Transcript_2861/m.6551 type:complete len:221 (+) Transcript_2861:73-735(+)